MNDEKANKIMSSEELDDVLPKYEPIKLSGKNLAQNYVSAFNTGMNIYQCLNYLQGNIDWTIKSVNDAVKSWNTEVSESIDQSKAIVRETTTEQFNEEWTNKQPELIEQVNTLTTNQFNEDWGVLENRINTTLETQNTKINSIQTQQTTLSNRMDTFTSLSEGSTTGDAELKDIRVGANGITYNNAGDAVRGQYSQLKEDIADYRDVRLNAIDTIEKELNLNEFEVIKFNLENNSTWIASVAYVGVLIPAIRLNKAIKANPVNWKCVIAFLIDSNIVEGEKPHYCEGTSLYKITGGTKELTIPSDCKYMYVYVGNKTNEIHITNMESASKISDVDSRLHGVVEMYRHIISMQHFVNGTTLTWNGTGDYDGNIKYRITNKKPVIYDHSINVQTVGDFSLIVSYFSDGVYVSDTDWCKTAFIPKNTEFKIIIKRDIEDRTETASIEEFYDALISEYVIVAEVSNVKTEVSNVKTEVSNVKTEVSNVKKNNFYKPFEVMSVGHRGYSIEAPENTLSAFRSAKIKGFDVVEADIRFTSDNIPVLLHDSTINRTARNTDGSEITETINISDITYSQALEYDFGIWKGSEYTGTKIPTLSEFLSLCRNLSIIPLLDTYGVNTLERANIVRNLIKGNCLDGHVWINSSNYASLEYLSTIITNALYGVVSWSELPSDDMKSIIETLKNRGLNVFISIDKYLCNIDSYIELCDEYSLDMCLYTLNTEIDIINATHRAFCIASDRLVAKDVLYNANID